MKKNSRPANPWRQYEAEKARLQRLPLTPPQYEQAIRRLAERLGL